jgi:hypothetical protein
MADHEEYEDDILEEEDGLEEAEECGGDDEEPSELDFDNAQTQDMGPLYCTDDEEEDEEEEEGSWDDHELD